MLNRLSAPAFSKTFSFELPQPEIIRLKDGPDFVFLSGLQQEVFKFEIIFKAGKWWEPKKGVSHFTAIMLDKGTSIKSSREIAGHFDYYGAQIEISPGYDFTSVSLYGLKKHFDKIFSLFWEILTGPSFPENEFDLQKDIFIQNLRVNNEKNSFVASKIIRRNIFGANHPYGSSIEESDVSSVTINDISNYFNLHFSPFEIYLMGNFDEARIQSITKRLSSFRRQNLEEPFFSLVKGPPIEKVIKSGSVQSSVRLGKQIINRNHPDYFSLLLLNHILGGYFGSRLMKNIREEKGLTYGIYSSLNPFKKDCMFSIGADVGNEKTDLALSEIKRELQKLADHLISDEELVTAKNHFLGSLQLEVANPFASMDKIKSLRLNQLGSDYYKSLFESINRSDSNSLLVIAEKYFSANDLIEVSVG